jgi:hypothetical protein
MWEQRLGIQSESPWGRWWERKWDQQLEMTWDRELVNLLVRQ